jgi:tetratricopeptide (TPR) repeat protein
MSKSCGRDIQERARLLLEALLNYKPSRDRESFERLLKADLESTPKPRRGYDKNQKLAFNIYELNDETGRVIEASLYSLAKITKFTGNKELSEQQVDGVIYCLCLKEFGILEQSSGQGATIRKLILKYENIRNRFDDACERWNTDKSKFHKPSLQKSQVNSTHHNDIPSNIPRSGVSFDRFFGRSHELEQLHQLLQQGNRVAIAAIAGMGGVGKTELAIQYAEQYKAFYPGGLCWLRVGESNLGSQIVQFAQFPLGLSVPQEWGGKPLNLDQQIAWCWQHWQPPGTVLVVLDDVTDLASCQDVLPPTNRFRVLVTTRKRQLDASFFELSLDVLKPLAALKLLESLVKRERLKREPWIARRLCKWLGYLPLGLELVGRYLAEDPDLSLAEMLERLQAQSLKDEALDLDEQQKQKNYPLMTAKRGVRAAFELSWQELDPATKNVSCLLSLFAPAVIPWKLVESTSQLLNWAAQDVDKARKHLFKRHLILRADERIYQIHSLIREFLKEKLKESTQIDELKQAFAATMVAVARQIPTSPTCELIAKISPSIPHIQAVTELTDFLSNEDLGKPFVGLGNFYQGQGLYELAEPWRKRSISVTQTRFGLDHPTVAASLNNLAGLYHAQGRYAEAEHLFVQALELQKRLQGDENHHVVIGLNNLANLYRVQGRYAEAEDLLLQALELEKRLGSVLELLSNFTQTLDLAERQLLSTADLCYLRDCLIDNDLTVATILNNLASLYKSQGRYVEAEPLLVKVLNLRKLLLGDEHPDVAESLNNLASIYQFQGRYPEAEELFEQALKLRKHLLGKEHPDVAVSLNNLARLYQFRGRYAEAEPLYKQALELYQRLLGEKHPDVAEILNGLASLYKAQGHYAEAEPLYKRALELCRRSLGEEHPDVAKNLDHLAALYCNQSRYAEAELLYKQALNFCQRSIGGEEHPNVATVLNNLANLYVIQGRHHEAEPLYKRVLELDQRLLGENHPDVATSLNNLAGLYYYQGRFREAEPLYKRVLKLDQRLLGANHPDVAASLNNLAALYYTQGRYKEAELYYVRGLKLCQRLLGDDHPDTIICRENLEKLRAELTSSANNSLQSSRGSKKGSSKKKYRDALTEYKRITRADNPE